MKHFILTLTLVLSLSFTSNAQTDTSEYCSYCITQAIGFSAGGGEAGFNLGVTFWILHGELNIGNDSRVPGGSTSQYDLTLYHGSAGLSWQLAKGLGLQLGMDFMEDKTYKRSFTTSSREYIGLDFRRHTETTRNWHSQLSHSETYISPYFGAQFNILGGTWLGCTYGFTRGAYFSIEFTF